MLIAAAAACSTLVLESAPADFATKRLRGGSPIERAEPGTEDFAPVFDVPDGNNVFQAYRFAFAEGWVGP